jgi:hypothetical protein
MTMLKRIFSRLISFPRKIRALIESLQTSIGIDANLSRERVMRAPLTLSHRQMRLSLKGKAQSDLPVDQGEITNLLQDLAKYGDEGNKVGARQG